MKNSKFYVSVLILFVFLQPLFLFALDVKELFKSNDVLPQISSDDFISGNRRSSFRWLSKTERVGAHYPGYRNSPALTFLGLKAWEANVRFKKQKINTIDISLYNRGDAGQIEEDKFEELLKKVDSKITEWMGSKAKDLARLRLPKNKGYIYNRVWVNGTLLVKMKWSLSKVKKSRNDKPEFINVNFSTFDPKFDPRKKTARRNTKKKNIVAKIKDNIKKNDDGDKYLANIPMVDQGPKGYCAVAVTERILRYYGQEIDQHVMAQLADTGAGGGTNSALMMKMLKKAGVKFGVKVKVHMKAKNSIELMQDMNKYNKVRKRKKLAKITPFNGFEQNYMQVKQDPETFKEFKCKKQKSDYKKFKKAIVKSIDAGIPLVWGVQLGLYPEEKLNPQTFGGHLRMIIGYNTKENEIVYSDTWGAGHEFKKMNWDNAWCMTTSYSNIYPRK